MEITALQPLTRAKFQRRALLVLTHSVNSLILPILNVVISLLVVRLASVELWGEFVHVLIIVQFAVHIMAWGNKEYLLREFSLNPAGIARAWQTSLITRLALFAPFSVAMALLGLPPQRWLWAILWGFALVLYQAHDVLILYKRDFVFSILVESCSLALLASAIAGSGGRINLEGLVALFALVHLAKGAVFLLRFRQYNLAGLDGRRPLRGRFDPRYFGLALPFFLLGFTGMLESRMDLYSVNFFLSKSEVGQYQVFINLMIYLQSVANFVLMPFAKTIYRLGYRTVERITVRLFIFGLFILSPLLALAHQALTRLYGFEMSPPFLLVGGLFVLPTYFYLPVIYALYRANRQSTVLKINVLGIAVNLFLNVLLLPRLGMMGAVVAAAGAQWLMFTAYLVQGRAMRGHYALVMPELS